MHRQRRSRSRAGKKRLWQYASVAALGVITTALIWSAMVMTSAGGQPRNGETPSGGTATEGGQLPYALWVGDSFTEGTGAADSASSYPMLVSRRLGWYPVIDAQGGTGFVADGKVNFPANVAVPQRLATIQVVPKVVVIDAGRNDGAADFATQITPAVTSYLDAIRARWPEAKIVLIVPYFLHSTESVLEFKNLYAHEAARMSAVLIDPFSEGWFDGENRADLTYTDGVHPNAKGHAYIAGRLIERLDSLGLH
jgi:acyl-CoA thioesterase-1